MMTATLLHPADTQINGLSGTVTQHSLLYLAGFGSFLQSEVSRGRTSHRPVQPAALRIRRLLRTAHRHVLHRPTSGQPAHVAVPHTSHGRPPAHASAARAARGSGVAGVVGRAVNDFHSAERRHQPVAVPLVALPSTSRLRLPSIGCKGLHTVCGAGSPTTKHGLAIHAYACNASMRDKSFTNSDGDMLIVPQQGTLHIVTEMGRLCVPVGHIAVVQRGINWSVAVDGVEQRLRAGGVRRPLPPARARPTRQQRPRQPARLPPPHSLVRGPRPHGGLWCTSMRATSFTIHSTSLHSMSLHGMATMYRTSTIWLSSSQPVRFVSTTSTRPSSLS